MNELDFVLSNPCLEKNPFTEKKVTAIQSWANFGKITQTKLKKTCRNSLEYLLQVPKNLFTWKAFASRTGLIQKFPLQKLMALLCYGCNYTTSRQHETKSMSKQ